jgi:hypothetical protein
VNIGCAGVAKDCGVRGANREADEYPQWADPADGGTCAAASDAQQLLAKIKSGGSFMNGLEEGLGC